MLLAFVRTLSNPSFRTTRRTDCHPADVSTCQHIFINFHRQKNVSIVLTSLALKDLDLEVLSRQDFGSQMCIGGSKAFNTKSGPPMTLSIVLHNFWHKSLAQPVGTSLLTIAILNVVHATPQIGSGGWTGHQQNIIACRPFGRMRFFFHSSSKLQFVEILERKFL